MRRVLLGLAAALFLGAGGPASAWTDGWPGYERLARAERERSERGEGRLSPDDAARKARRETGGRVLSIQGDQREGYRVKVLTPQGEVRYIHIESGSETR